MLLDLSYTLFDLDTFEVVQNGSVPATGETTLKWVGFTDDEVRSSRLAPGCEAQ